jgi:MerR family redox-sensitive transcriptional activator SoxR
MSATMTIGEVAREAGLATSAVRYYEQLGLIPPAVRRSGRRVFDQRALTQLRVVVLAREVGFSLDEIRQLVAEFRRQRWRPLAERKLREIAATQAQLRAMSAMLERLLQCRCFDVEVCGRALRRHGLGGPPAPSAPRLRPRRRAAVP